MNEVDCIQAVTREQVKRVEMERWIAYWQDAYYLVQSWHTPQPDCEVGE